VYIALDAMGGDHAPEETVQGAFLALEAFPNLRIQLVGIESAIRKHMKDQPEALLARVDVVHAEDVVDMAESPSTSFKRKKHSSIRVGLNLVKEGTSQGFVSAGNTGAMMLASILLLGKIPGVDRPALSAVIPTKTDPFVMLDMGSNVDCKPSHLEQFAVMGHYFSDLIMGVEKPRVALLNIGEEPDKGNSICLSAFPLLEKLPINFVGNVEGKDLLFCKADVVVCDGFVGNSILKFGEGATRMFMEFFKSEAKGSFLSILGLFLLKPALQRFKKKFDYDEHGGAPFLGVKGVSVVAHGNASRHAIKSAIGIALQAAEGQMVEKIAGALHR
jgi:phosphate acyltransferase